MEEEKFKRRIIAYTVGAVLLIVILLSVLVYQFISIRIERKKYKEYVEEIVRYEELKDDAEKELEAYSSYWWIVQRARELGLGYPDDVLK